jgi:hypothetical protein
LGTHAARTVLVVFLLVLLLVVLLFVVIFLGGRGGCSPADDARQNPAGELLDGDGADGARHLRREALLRREEGGGAEHREH